MLLILIKMMMTMMTKMIWMMMMVRIEDVLVTAVLVEEMAMVLVVSVLLMTVQC